MKWIIILTTLLSLSAQSVYADEEMPIGEVATPSSWASKPSGNSASRAKRNKKPTDKQTEKQADYTPAQDLLLSAMSLIGVKYTWGGNTPESGLDCSGFIRYVFQNSMNLTLPRTAFEMAQKGKTIDKSELKPGDLVFFNTLGRTFSHVGIYLGDNRFIHSPRAGRSVEVANMGINYWTTRFTGARRIADTGNTDGLNVNAMLAASSNENKRSAVATTAVSSGSKRVCKKVVTGKGKNKKTVTQCATVSSKPSTAQVRTTKAQKSTVASRKPSSKKVTATKKATSAKKTTSKPATKTPTKTVTKTSTAKPKTSSQNKK
ncbi:NlpC/P60 family protein [Deefgea salmonis]|uniref:C40 family peptidase n=1 Tax=Deefgea salmonis TaxID=2875502 RepID=A0ABS8BHW1_9NEIS|nr:NlpC/P60 family protein [Deefgea salmonis]MCB5195278.1 C40 family peptidase [Deefgea salmonis]